MTHAALRNDLTEELAAGTVRKHHTSRTRGYVSRKGNGYVRGYNGRFGKGYAVISPAFDSTQYCWITYYVA